MAKTKLYDLEAKLINEIDYAKQIKLDAVHNQALFDVVVAEHNATRQGTHSTLTKGEVRGGGRKPLAQKHTGNARQGSIRNPHWVGGGVVFGPKPGRNYKNKVNQKVHSLALQSALKQLVDNNQLFALTNEISKEVKTAQVVKLLTKLELNNNKVLLVANEDADRLIRSCRNIAKVTVKKWNQVSVKDLLSAKAVIGQQNALDAIFGGIK